MNPRRLPGRYSIGSDGLPVLQVGLWTLDKHYYLSRYIDAFTTGMKSLWASRVYIDIFSGPGRCKLEDTQQEEPGSPLIALDARFGFTGFRFNDSEPVAIEALRRRITPDEATQVSFSIEDCNEACARIGAALDSRSLCLAFIDPFNWEIAFSSIAKLVRRARVDLVLTFHSGSIKRAADFEPTALHSFFGGRAWKKQYDESRRSGRREGTRVLLDSYETNLRNLGYRFIRDHVLVENSQGTPLYHLVFASRHQRGDDFWNKVTAKGPRGQMRLLL